MPQRTKIILGIAIGLPVFALAAIGAMTLLGSPSPNKPQPGIPGTSEAEVADSNALAHEKVGQWQEAFADLQEAQKQIAAHPDARLQASINQDVSAVFEHLGNASAAETAIDRALDSDKLDPLFRKSAYQQAVRISYRLGHYDLVAHYGRSGIEQGQLDGASALLVTIADLEVKNEWNANNAWQAAMRLFIQSGSKPEQESMETIVNLAHADNDKDLETIAKFELKDEYGETAGAPSAPTVASPSHQSAPSAASPATVASSGGRTHGAMTRGAAEQGGMPQGYKWYVKFTLNSRLQPNGMRMCDIVASSRELTGGAGQNITLQGDTVLWHSANSDMPPGVQPYAYGPPSDPGYFTWDESFSNVMASLINQFAHGNDKISRAIKYLAEHGSEAQAACRESAAGTVNDDGTGASGSWAAMGGGSDGTKSQKGYDYAAPSSSTGGAFSGLPQPSAGSAASSGSSPASKSGDRTSCMIVSALHFSDPQAGDVTRPTIFNKCSDQILVRYCETGRFKQEASSPERDAFNSCAQQNFNGAEVGPGETHGLEDQVIRAGGFSTAVLHPVACTVRYGFFLDGDSCLLLLY